MVVLDGCGYVVIEQLPVCDGSKFVTTTEAPQTGAPLRVKKRALKTPRGTHQFSDRILRNM